MLTIPNLPTQDGYVDALTLGPVPAARMLKYVVANKAVFARVWPQSKSGTIPAQTDELLITPETNIITDAMGMQFRSASPGVPAQVIAQLLEPGDPTLGSGTPFSATLSSTGGISPGVSSVQVQHNGALIATEPSVNFVDALGVAWTVADDAANLRATIEAQPVAIASIQLAAPAGSFLFSAIPQTFKHLLLEVALIADGAAARDCAIVLNGDANGAHYFRSIVDGGSSVGGSSASTNVGIGLVAGISTDFPLGGTLKIFDYTSLNAHTYRGDGGYWDGALAHTYSSWGRFTPPGAINSLQLQPSTGNFAAGTMARLYGID